MREQEMVARDWMRMDKVKYTQEVEGGDLLAVFRSIVQDGGIIMLGEGDLEEKERIGEDVVESQADSYVDKKLTAVIMEGRLYTRN